MNKIKVALLIAILGISIIVYANDTTGESYTQLFGFYLTKSTLSDVQSKMGDAPVIVSGDAADSSHRINYYFKKENCYIRFNSGEMGGGIYITSFTLCSGKPDEEFLSKDAMNLSGKDLGGLRIGMTIDDIKRLFGNDVKIEKDVFLFIFESKRPMTEEEKKYFQEQGTDISKYPYYDIGIVIRCTFSKDKIQKISVTKTVSS